VIEINTYTGYAHRKQRVGTPILLHHRPRLSSQRLIVYTSIREAHAVRGLGTPKQEGSRGSIVMSVCARREQIAKLRQTELTSHYRRISPRFKSRVFRVVIRSSCIVAPI